MLHDFFKQFERILCFFLPQHILIARKISSRRGCMTFAIFFLLLFGGGDLCQHICFGRMFFLKERLRDSKGRKRRKKCQKLFFFFIFYNFFFISYIMNSRISLFNKKSPSLSIKELWGGQTSMSRTSQPID